MATRFQGITIEINGETTKLSNALKSVNNDLFSVNKELSNVNRALKLDPTNIDLLATKQNDLSLAIQTTSQKLEKLKQAESEYNSLSAEEKEKNKAGYTELITEISKVSVSLAKLKENEQQNNLQLNQNKAGLTKLKSGFDDLKDKTLGKVSESFDTLKSKLGLYSDETEDASSKTSVFGDVLKANLTTEAIKVGINAVASSIKAIGSAMTEVIKTGIEYNSTMEGYQTSFTAMLDGDSKKAEEVIQTIKEGAIGSPFDVASLVQANQSLLTTGISAEDAQKDIMALGDAIAYTGGGNDELTRMATNLQQIKNVGKATSTDIKQFANAGIDIYGILSDYTGKSVSQVQDMDISYEMLSGALRKASEEGGKYYGSMSRQASTYAGQMSMLSAGWSEFAGTLTSEVTTALSQGFLPALNETITSMSTGFQENGIEGMTTALVDGLENIISLIAEELPEFLESGAKILEGVMNGILQSFPTIMPTIIQLMQTLIADIVEYMPEIIAIGGEMLLQLSNGIIEMLPELLPAIVEVVGSIASSFITEGVPKLIEVGANLIEGLWQGISNVKDWLMSKISGFFGGVVDSIKEFFGIASPSKLFRDEIGGNLALGIGVGFEKQMPSVIKDVNDSMSQLNAKVMASTNPTINPTTKSNINNFAISFSIDNSGKDINEENVKQWSKLIAGQVNTILGGMV